MTTIILSPIALYRAIVLLQQHYTIGFVKHMLNTAIAILSLDFRRKNMAATFTFITIVTTTAIENFRPISALCCVSYRNQSYDLHCKSNDWFLYETQHWAETG